MAATRGGLRRLGERLRLPLVLADQGLVSGAGFLSTILLARVLGVAAFGRFTLLWIAVLFVNSLQFAAVIQPMMSIGVKHAESEMPAYYGAVIVHQLMTSAIAFVALVIGVEASAVIAPAWGIRGLVLPLGAAMFTGQTQDFLRRYLFVRGRPLAALTNDGIRYLGQLALLYAANELSGDLTIALALWVMAMAATLGTVHGVLCLENVTFSNGILQETTRRHWRLAKWLVPSVLMSWGTGHVYLLTAGAVLGATTVGVLRAAQAIFGVVDILFIALDNFVPVQASEILHRRGSKAFHRYLKGLTWKLGGVVLLLMLLINLNAKGITRIVYGGKYPTMDYLLLEFSIVYSAGFFVKILHYLVLSIEVTEIEFVSWTFAAIFTLTTAYPFVFFGGINGVLLGTALVYSMWSAITCIKLRKKRQPVLNIINLGRGGA